MEKRGKREPLKSGIERTEITKVDSNQNQKGGKTISLRKPHLTTPRGEGNPMDFEFGRITAHDSSKFILFKFSKDRQFIGFRFLRNMSGEIGDIENTDEIWIGIDKLHELKEIINKAEWQVEAELRHKVIRETTKRLDEISFEF